MNYKKKYLSEAIGFSGKIEGFSGTVAWKSPSNIALIKYWGKRKGQLPMNPSLSFSLSKSVTVTRMKYRFTDQSEGPVVNYFFAGNRNPDFSARIEPWLKSLLPYFPFLRNLELEIHSENTFPHSSGIASSASAFSSLALCLTEIEQRIKKYPAIGHNFFNKASYIARLGSGSACRSVYEGWVLWGSSSFVSGSSDEIAIPVNTLVHTEFSAMGDSILVVDDTSKSVSSSAGHAMMNQNPYAKTRFRQAQSNLNNLLTILSTGDIPEFFNCIEYEALSLHAMMMTSYPGYILLKPRSLEIMEKVRQKRKSGLPVGFTVDAGANIHLLYPLSYRSEMGTFIRDELLRKSQIQVIDDYIGKGPERIGK